MRFQRYQTIVGCGFNNKLHLSNFQSDFGGVNMIITSRSHVYSLLF